MDAVIPRIDHYANRCSEMLMDFTLSTNTCMFDGQQTPIIIQKQAYVTAALCLTSKLITTDTVYITVKPTTVVVTKTDEKIIIKIRACLMIKYSNLFVPIRKILILACSV